MTADEAAAVSTMYSALGAVVRELGPAIDALAALEHTPLGDVGDVAAGALTRCRRAWDVAAGIRERYG